jgi:hypothetical protein
MAAVRIMGLLGESRVGAQLNLLKNKTFILGVGTTLSGKMRIPDFYDQATKTLIEVKNASMTSLTSQLQDMIVWSVQNGYKFTLYVSGEVTASLQQLQAAGIISIVKF